MKKLLFILPAFLFTLSVNAQGTQTEDEVYVGKGKTFGKYTGKTIIIPDVGKSEKKPITNSTVLTGIVTGGGVVSGGQDTLKSKLGGLYSFNLKTADGTIVTIGTRDNGFTVPRTIEGHTIIIEGIDAGRRRRDVNINYQKEIQFAATGIKVID